MIDFMIIGAQKAATSALQQALRGHPDIYMPAGESPFFEDPDYQSHPWEDFATEQKVRLRGIKRPDYICSDEALGRISQALPEARFILVLREPVSRAVSSYCYMVRHAHLPALALNEGMMRCIDLFESGEMRDRATEVIRYGLYGSYLAKWQQVYPAERFLVLSQKLVSGEPQRALELAARHLGVDPALLPAPEIGRSNEGLYDPQMLRIARVGSLIKTRPVPGSTRRVPRALPLRAAGTLVSRYAEARARRRGQKAEVLDPQVRTRLDAIYDADLPLLLKAAGPDPVYWHA